MRGDRSLVPYTVLFNEMGWGYDESRSTCMRTPLSFSAHQVVKDKTHKMLTGCSSIHGIS